MAIKAKVDEINAKRKALFTDLLDRADAFKSGQRETMQDADHSAQWIAERVRELADGYQAERYEAVQQGLEALEALYDGLLEDVAQVMSKAPTADEMAYLQAFCLKGRVTENDLALAEAALKGNAAALAAARSHARECGLKTSGDFSYLRASELHGKCKGELRDHATGACALVRTGGCNGIGGEFQAAFLAESEGDEFTAAALSVADFE